MSSRRPFHHSLIYFAAAAAVLLITPATAEVEHWRCYLQVEKIRYMILVPTSNKVDNNWRWRGVDSVSLELNENYDLYWYGGKWNFGRVGSTAIAHLATPGNSNYSGGETCFIDNSILRALSANDNDGVLVRLDEPYYTTCPPFQGFPNLLDINNKVPVDTGSSSLPASLKDCVAHAYTDIVDTNAALTAITFDPLTLQCFAYINESYSYASSSTWSSSDIYYSCIPTCVPIPGIPLIHNPNNYNGDNAAASQMSGSFSSLAKCDAAVATQYSDAMGAKLTRQTDGSHTCYAVPTMDGGAVDLNVANPTTDWCFGPRGTFQTTKTTTPTTTTTTTTTTTVTAVGDTASQAEAATTESSSQEQKANPEDDSLNTTVIAASAAGAAALVLAVTGAVIHNWRRPSEEEEEDAEWYGDSSYPPPAGNNNQSYNAGNNNQSYNAGNNNQSYNAGAGYGQAYNQTYPQAYWQYG